MTLSKRSLLLCALAAFAAAGARAEFPSKPLRMFVNYNTDISQFWEWSDRGLRSVSDTNEAYKLGVNAILYGLAH